MRAIPAWHGRLLSDELWLQEMVTPSRLYDSDWMDDAGFGAQYAIGPGTERRLRKSNNGVGG